MASTGDALPEAVRTAQLSSDAFAYFGMPPLIGRTFADPPVSTKSRHTWPSSVTHTGSAATAGVPT